MHFDDALKDLPVLFCSLFVSILFIQSGLDKVFDRKGNLEWLMGHFEKTILNGTVPLLLFTITILEIVTGVLAVGGIIYLVATGSRLVAFIASVAGASALSALFFGQRVAKDYAGAAVLVPYFILLIILMYLSNPFTKAV